MPRIAVLECRQKRPLLDSLDVRPARHGQLRFEIEESPFQRQIPPSDDRKIKRKEQTKDMNSTGHFRHCNAGDMGGRSCSSSWYYFFARDTIKLIGVVDTVQARRQFEIREHRQYLLASAVSHAETASDHSIG